jgi:hypothetical protein
MHQYLLMVVRGDALRVDDLLPAVGDDEPVPVKRVVWLEHPDHEDREQISRRAIADRSGAIVSEESVLEPVGNATQAVSIYLGDSSVTISPGDLLVVWRRFE